MTAIGLSAARPRVGWLTTLLYGLGAASTGVKMRALSSFLLIFYNQSLGLAPTSVALAISIITVFDAVVDPLTGFASDRLRSRWGRRHPFMYAAALPVAGAFYLLWNPPAGLGDGGLFAWLLVCLMALRLFDTFFELPSLALGPELVQDYDGRTILVSSRIFFRTMAGVLFAIAAFQIFLPESDGGVTSREGYRSFAIAGSVVMFASIVTSALATHRFIPWLAKPESKRLSGLSFFADIGRLLRNRPARIMLAVGMLVAIVNGARSGLEIYFGLYFWGLSQAQLTTVTAVTAAGTLLGALAAPQLSRRLGKRLGVLCGYVSAIAVSLLPILARLADWLPGGASPLTFSILVGQAFLQGLLYVVTAVLMNAMLADVVEDVEVQSGRRAEGLLFSADAFFSKAVSGLGVLIAGGVLALVRFPEDARTQGVSPEVAWNLGATFLPLTLVFSLAVIFLLAAFPIDRQRHAANLAKLGESRAAAPRKD
jgi:GPH family glycoside/pentoside/hexuronide:cation symporter